MFQLSARANAAKSRVSLRGQAEMSGLLFENSIVCLVVFICCFCHAFFSFGGVVLDASFGVLFGQIFLI